MQHPDLNRKSRSLPVIFCVKYALGKIKMWLILDRNSAAGSRRILHPELVRVELGEAFGI